MADWFAMGSYGAYIWTAYGLSALGLAALTIVSWRAYVRAKRQARALAPESGK